MALGLEQFKEFAEENKFHLSIRGKMRLKDAAFYIQKYMMPCRDATKLYFHIKELNQTKTPDNPVKYFFKHGEVLTTIHYVVPLDKQGMVPPCMRQPEELPYQWMNFIYPPVQVFVILIFKRTAINEIKNLVSILVFSK